MEKLDKAYEAIEMLKNLGLPVSSDLLKSVAQMEREYLTEEILPLLKQNMEPLIEKMQNSFQMEITYEHEIGLNIRLQDCSKMKQNLFGDPEDTGRRKKRYILRVIFPDNTVSCHKMVSETLVDVVRYAGVENVRRLGIVCMGDNLVSAVLNENERYRVGQKEVEPGLYVCTYSSTETKLEQIKTISKELQLNLRVEKVML